MVEVQRGNVCLDIPEADIPKYMAKGFSVVDEYGRVIKQSVPTEIGQLQKAYSEHVATIKAKDIEIASLKAELQALKTAEENKTSAVEPKAPKKKKEVVEEPVEEETSEEDWDDWGNAEEIVEEKPTKKKKSVK